MASSSSANVKGKDDGPKNWAELPSELMYSIMLRLGVVDILDSAQKVCTSWRRVSKDPSMWQKIDMMRGDLGDHRLFPGDHRLSPEDNRLLLLGLRSMCRQAVDRSEGCLIDINFGITCDDDLINYVAERSSNLRILTVDVSCSIPRMTNKELVNAVAKLPMLEELEISHTMLNPDLEAIGHSCPRLKTLKLRRRNNLFILGVSDDAALAIAESMTELRHLELHGNNLTDTGLTAILDNCPHLEHLDLSYCCFVSLLGNLEKRCSEMIKCFIPPKVRYFYDSEDGYDMYGLDYALR